MVQWLRDARTVGAVQCAALLALLFVAPSARAATLEWSGPQACAIRSELTEEVERLIERPLAEVGTLRFSVQVTGKPGQLRLQLETREAAGARAVRTLPGRTCSELAQAAAIAIALAVRESEQGSGEEAAAHPARAQALALREPEDASTAASDGNQDVAQQPLQRQAARESAWGASLGLAGLIDSGSLPGVGPGAELEASLKYESVRLMGAGGLFASREVRRSDGSGGEFQLAFAALLLCAERLVRTPFVLLGCAGAEVGRLSAQGFGVSDPEQGSSAWRALRVEVGAAWLTGDSVRLFLRAGAGIPLTRAQFLIGGTERLHQPRTLASRALLGVELDL
jgi:hypothetical protein